MERIGDVGVFRLEGEHRLDPAVKLVADAIRLARESGLRKLMVDASGVTGVVAAASFGLHGDVFTSEGPALAWLEEQP